MKESLNVINERGLWIVKKNGIVQSIHLKKEAAINVARTIAHNRRIDLTIQNRKGDIYRVRP